MKLKFILYLSLFLILINIAFAGNFTSGSQFTPGSSNVTYNFITTINFTNFTLNDTCMIIDGGNYPGEYCLTSPTAVTVNFPAGIVGIDLVYKSKNGSGAIQSDPDVLTLIDDDCTILSFDRFATTCFVPNLLHNIDIEISDDVIDTIDITTDSNWSYSFSTSNYNSSAFETQVLLEVSNRSFDTHWINVVACNYFGNCTTEKYYWQRPELNITTTNLTELDVFVDYDFYYNVTYNSSMVGNTQNFIGFVGGYDFTQTLNNSIFLDSTTTDGVTVDEYMYTLTPTNGSNITFYWKFCLSSSSIICDTIGPSAPQSSVGFYFNQNFTVDTNVNIRVFKANDSTLLTQLVNMTVQNSTHELNYSFTGGLFNLTNLVFGSNYNFYFNSSGYTGAIYNKDYNEDFAINGLNAYIQQDNNLNVEFTIIDTVLNEIPSATISIEKFVNGTRQIVGIQQTDATGKTLFNLQENTIHFLSISANGFQSRELEIFANQIEYTIKLEGLTDLIFNGPLTGVGYSFSPTNFTLRPGLEEFQFNVTSGNANLEYYSIEIFNGSTLVSLVNDTNVNGGNLSLIFNTTPYNNSFIIVKYDIKLIDEQLNTITVLYRVNNLNYTQFSSLNNLRTFSQQNLSVRDQIIIWFILLLVFIIAAAILTKNGIVTAFLTSGWMPMSAWFLGFAGSALSLVGVITFILVVSILAVIKNSEAL